MKYIVYKTTCLVNGKIYVGVHQTEDPEKFDGYLGRGYKIGHTHFLQHPAGPIHYAIKKYGESNFKRETLYVYDRKEDAYLKEAEIVNEDFVNSEKTYNVALGGVCSPIIAKPVYQFNLQGELIASFSSALEAAKSIELSPGRIRAMIKDKITHHDFILSNQSVLENFDEYKITKPNNYYLYNTNGEFVAEIEDLTKVKELLYTNSGNISRAVKCGYKVAGFFITTERLDNVQITISRTSGQINRYTLDGKYIDSFKTVREAEEKTGLKLNSISTAIKACRSCNGFRWTRGDNPEPYIHKQ